MVSDEEGEPSVDGLKNHAGGPSIIGLGSRMAR